MKIDLDRIQKYLNWISTKMTLDQNASDITRTTPHIKNVYRGKVYYCSFGVGIGSEERKNNRPCVVLQRHSSNLSSPNTIVAPITNSSSTLDIVVPIATQYNTDHTIKLSGNVLLANIVTVSKIRLGAYITDLPPAEMKKIDEALARATDLYHYYKDLEDNLKDKITYLSKVKSQRNEAQDNLKDLYTLLGVADFTNAKVKIQELLAKKCE